MKASLKPGLTHRLNFYVPEECIAVDGRRVHFDVSGHDWVDRIGQGRHQRMIVLWDRFAERVASKAKAAGAMVS